MSKKLRALTAGSVGAGLFVGLFAFLGYHLGLAHDGQVYLGWSGALMVGGMAAVTVVVCIVVAVVVILACEWIERGD